MTDLVLNLFRDINDNFDLSILAQVLTEIGNLDVGGVLPATVILQEVEWQHATTVCLSVWVVFERPLHDGAAFIYAFLGVARSTESVCLPFLR